MRQAGYTTGLLVGGTAIPLQAAAYPPATRNNNISILFIVCMLISAPKVYVLTRQPRPFRLDASPCYGIFGVLRTNAQPRPSPPPLSAFNSRHLRWRTPTFRAGARGAAAYYRGGPPRPFRQDPSQNSKPQKPEALPLPLQTKTPPERPAHVAVSRGDGFMVVTVTWWSLRRLHCGGGGDDDGYNASRGPVSRTPSPTMVVGRL